MKEKITSISNQQIKRASRLRNRRDREREKLFLIDGVRPLKLALAAGVEIKVIYYDTSRPHDELLSQARYKGVALQGVSSEVAARLCYGDNPDGHVGIASPPVSDINSLKLPENPLIIVTQSLEKPGNTGAVFRSADAAGADAHIICDPVTDAFNPNIIRSSQGTVFTVPFAVASSAEAIEWLKKNSIRVYSAFPGKGINYTEADLTGRTAVCIGNEHSGLSDAWLKTSPVHISMKGKADSLNAAQTATLLLFEAVRQRGSGV